MDLMRREALIETYGLAEATRMMNNEGMFEQPETPEKYLGLNPDFIERIDKYWYSGSISPISQIQEMSCSGNIFVYKPSTGSGT